MIHTAITIPEHHQDYPALWQSECKKFRIVGPDEIYDRNDYISIDSPMARALLKKQVDDDFEVMTPQGAKQWYVNNISYQK